MPIDDVLRMGRAASTRRRFVHAFGNGTTALYAALRAVGCCAQYVAVPATVCPNVIAAIFASGNKPHFVDIERARLGLDPEKLSSILREVGAVIAVHSFGIPCLIDRIKALCLERSVPLIEDCAQAEGAVYNGSAVGEFGDIAIYSYGAGKIIDAGGGGTSITRNPQLSRRLHDEHQKLPGRQDQHAGEELSAFYKFLYNQFYPDRLAPYRAIFGALVRDFGLRMLARHNTRYDRLIERGQANLSENIRSRREKAKLYEALLAGAEEVEILLMPQGAVPWRFNLRIDFKARQHVLRTMLRKGFAISSWYPEFTRFIDERQFRATPLLNSAWLGDGILNFWVDHETSKSRITATCKHLLTHLGTTGSAGLRPE